MEITYGSVCSGIEAATQGWHPLGMRAAWFAEIEPFPSAVLAHHYPDVPNHGDMTKLAALPGKETAVSEVKRYHVTETGLVEGESLGRLSVVLAADFDRVTAGRDAALAELGRYQSLFNQAQKAIDRLNELHRKRMAEIGRSLTAADERADVLTSALEGMLEYFHEGHSDGECFSVEMAKAALKPAEVERNQCDGCQAGIPVVNGAHRMGKPDGYPDTMSCTAKMYVEERPDGCCCPPKGHTGLWAAAMCPVHQGLRALKR